MESKILVDKQTDVAIELNTIVSAVTVYDETNGFEKAFQKSNAIIRIKSLLSDEYMKPIMALQGSRLGFKTDKDASGGYTMDVVKNCLIEAVLSGLQPYGNEFNIIAGNCYFTKEGLGSLLAKVPGLSYEIIPTLPRINADKTSAAAIMKIVWTYQGKTSEREIDFAIKVNQYMGADAVIGKATRKARAWLYGTIIGTEIADGDTTDVEYKLVLDYKTGKEEYAEKFDDKIKDQKAKKEAADAKPGEQTTLV